MRGTTEENARLLNPLNKVYFAAIYCSPKELHPMFEFALVYTYMQRRFIDCVDSQAYLGI